MTFEVEQKFVVDQPDTVAANLAALGASLHDAIRQSDVYFAHPSRDFAATDEALRIRRVGSSNCVTYKGPKVDQVTKTRREIEISLPSGDAAAAQFAAMLEALGFSPVAEVYKLRHPGQLTWHGRAVETAIDNVRGVGTFAELEVLAEDSELDEARACIQSLAEKLELTVSERRSYLELLLANDSEAG